MKRKKNSERYFLGKAISRELKKWKAGEMKDLSWLAALSQNDAFDLICDAVTAKIEKDLAREGLFHPDGDDTVIPLENGIPGLSKRKSYQAEIEEDADESIYDPESLDDIYLEARIAEDDEVEECQLEASASDEAGGDSLHPYLPKIAVPSSHALMRRYPLDLKEAIARDLFDAHAFLSGENQNLLPALCFFEVGINDPETFAHVWEEAYKGGPFHLKGKAFSFSEFQKDKLRLFHRLKREKERFFNRNPWVREKKHVASLWARFEDALNSLTRKQWNVVKQVRVKRRKQTAVAREFRISLDSLRDRLEGAELKFRRAIPELAGFFPSETYKSSAKTNYIYDGLFDKREKPRPLYRIDLKTKEKTEIPIRTGPKKYKPGVNPAVIKAWAHDTTPVPDFSFTDFFTRLISKGALVRQSAGDDSPHDKASGSSGFTDRMQAHEKRRPSPELPDDERSEE